MLSQSPPSDQLQQCLSEVEAVKKLIQTHTPQAAKSDGSENVQKKIEDYVYKFLSDSSMQIQTEFISKLSPLMMTAYSSGGNDGLSAYQLVSNVVHLHSYSYILNHLLYLTTMYLYVLPIKHSLVRHHIA